MPVKTPQQTVNTSLVTAFVNLFAQLQRPVNVDRLTAALSAAEDPDEIWDAASAVDPQVTVAEEGDYGSYPASNDAIIRFQYQSIEKPYILVNGERVANVLDHYCLVSHHGERLILDSADGIVKNTHVYGQPISWAAYQVGNAPEAVQEPVQLQDDGRSYTVLSGGENAWEIARKLNIGLNGQDILDHNDLDNADIPAGTVLHLPVAIPEKEPEARITYEPLETPLQMHVAKPGGTRKYAFNNAKKWADLKQTGPNKPQHENLNIVAIAHVPIEGETAAYYMEGGDYDTSTGKIKWTLGYNHSHLGEGHVEAPKPEPKPEVKQMIQDKLDEAKQRQEMIEAVEAENNPPSKRMGSDSLPTPEEEQAELTNFNLWKTTYLPLNEERLPQVFLFNEDLIVQDLAGQRRDVLVYKLKGVKIAGTFEKDGVLYGRPQDAMDNFTWYGIPMDKITLEDEVFNYNIPLPERAALKNGRLSANERYVSVPLARLAAQRVRFSQFLHNIKNK